ncbi:MAG: peptide-methionine (R)-S-oxide reductase MsrB [Pseudorhodoplanes sp.]
MTDRRKLLAGIAAGAAAFWSLRWLGGADAATDGKKTFEIEKSAEEWRTMLTPAQFYVLRQHGTERAGTSALNAEKRNGVYACAGCALPLFASDTKFESGTGWPSFYAPLDNAVGTSVDRSFLMTRTEVHCRRCGGHLGHVFEDGPRPTGLRYCINGVALAFAPAARQG